MRHPARSRFLRLFLTACCALALCGLALPLRADPVPVKGKSGTIVEFEIQEVTKEGFRGVRKGATDAILVKWDQVDLEWLKENQPELHQKMLDAAAAAEAQAAAGAPAAEAAPKADPVEIAKTLITDWNTQRIPPRQNGNQFGGGGGGQFGGGGGNRNQGGGGNGGNNAPQPTITAFLKQLESAGDTARTAYTRLESDHTLRKNLVSQVETAVSQLRKLRTPENARIVDPLISTGNECAEGLNTIGRGASAISRPAITGVIRFLTRWQATADAK